MGDETKPFHQIDPALSQGALRRAREETRTAVRLRMLSGHSEIESVQLVRSSTRSRVIVDLVRDARLDREIEAYAAERQRQDRERDYEGGVAHEPLFVRVRHWEVSVTSDDGEIPRVKHQTIWAGGSDTPNRAVWLFEHIPAGRKCTVSLADEDGQIFWGRFGPPLS